MDLTYSIQFQYSVDHRCRCIHYRQLTPLVPIESIYVFQPIRNSLTNIEDRLDNICSKDRMGRLTIPRCSHNAQSAKVSFPLHQLQSEGFNNLANSIFFVVYIQFENQCNFIEYRVQSTLLHLRPELPRVDGHTQTLSLTTSESVPYFK